ncbi:hypothetical protein ACT691_16555 [Vibrio metschnikovii]
MAFLVQSHFSSSAVLCHVPESVSPNQLLTHWHSILQVTLNHQRYFIRPYSPMFWRNHAAQLNQDDQSIFSLVRYKLWNGLMRSNKYKAYLIQRLR